jgi:environmental stress-induced protein Ves
MPDRSFTSETLDPRAYRRTPWKNGGGVTIDIACAYHPGTSSDDWNGIVWRFGRTRIERPGPFSDLSGYDRILSVIEGRGLVLRREAAPEIDVREAFRPVSFPGEWSIESKLEAGAVGVLNLITDRRSARGEVRFLSAGEGGVLDTDIIIAYAPRGQSSFLVETQRFDLRADEAILIRSRGVVSMQQEAGISAIAAVHLGRRASSGP